MGIMGEGRGECGKVEEGRIENETSKERKIEDNQQERTCVLLIDKKSVSPNIDSNDGNPTPIVR